MADYLSQFTGPEIDSRLAKVPQLESAVSGKQDALVSGTNIKTINGQPVLGSGNMTIQSGDTDAVKYVSQTLTAEQKAQARANIDAASLEDIQDMDFVTATTLPTASASTMGHIYLIGPDANDNYDRYFTQESGGSYSWVSLGSTQIDLSTYATKAEVDQLEAKVDDLSTGKYYGYFAQEEDLPEADVDGFAYVGEGPTYTIYNCVGGVWTSSDITVNQSPIGNDEDIDQNEDGKLQFANRVYNAQQPNGMGYKILRKDATFASQVTDTNTIYEIRYDFTLPENISIPSGCVLLFKGGSISGASTLTFNETRIEGNAKISCDCAGTIDGLLELNWFGLKSEDPSFDNGVIINKYGNLSNQVVISVPGNYYFSTPIVLTRHVFVDFNVSLYYNGSNGNLSSITFQRGNVGLISPDIHLRYLECVRSSVNPDYSHDESYFLNEDANTIILRGVEFSSTNNAKIKVDTVTNFNENIRISDVNAKGNSYNEYHIGCSHNANVHIRVYQNSGGWCYGNKLYAQRLTNSWSSFSDGQSNHYYSCGGMFAGPGTQTDTHNDNSNWVIEKTSTEGFDDYCFLLKNCGNFTFRGGKVETSGRSPYLAKVIGYTSNVSVESYILSKSFDLSEAIGFSFKKNPGEKFLISHLDSYLLKAHCHKTSNATYNFAIDNNLPIGGAYYRYRDSCKFIKLTEDTDGSVKINADGTISLSSNHYIGLVLDTSRVKRFMLSAEKAGVYLQIVYLTDNNGNTIVSNSGGAEQIACGLPLNNSTGSNRFAWDSSVYAFNASVGSTQDYDFYFTIPDGIASVLLRIKTANFNLFGFGDSKAMVSIPSIRMEGTTSQRPKTSANVDYTNNVRDNATIPYIGMLYCDTDLGKMILWNGTAWVNMDGTALS